MPRQANSRPALSKRRRPRRGNLEACLPNQTFTNYYNRWQELGGMRFYTAARWFVLLLFGITGSLLAHTPLWPLSGAGSTVAILIWCYALFNVLATIALFLPWLGALLNVAFIIDIAF